MRWNNFFYFYLFPICILNMVALAFASGSGIYILLSKLTATTSDIDIKSAIWNPPTTNGRIQLPRNIRGTQYQDPIHIITNTLHLNKKLSFDPSRCFRFAFSSLTTQRIHFINENYCRFAFSCQLK